jgi:hypothetical protein
MASSASTLLDDFGRYALLTESALAASPATFTPEAETANSIQVERGVAYAAAMLNPKEPSGAIDLLLEAGDRPDPDYLASFAVVDRNGHQRPHYRGLLFYAAFQAFQGNYETLGAGSFGKWEEGLRPWADMLEAQLTQVPPLYAVESGEERPVIPASRGGVAADAAWMALALHVAGRIYIRDAWTDLASDLFGKIARGQQGSGAFLATTTSDNPETRWYHELVLLHAASTYAVQTEDRPLAAAIARATDYHASQTQPDHATNQPWGLFAFIWNSRTRPLADGLLHSASAMGERSPLTSILLADALYCLRLFLR